jgi:hypothetical protein
MKDGARYEYDNGITSFCIHAGWVGWDPPSMSSTVSADCSNLHKLATKQTAFMKGSQPFISMYDEQ